MATTSPDLEAIDWEQITAWDREYYIHPFRTLGEYVTSSVASAEGAYLQLVDGRRILDFMSQYICVNIGHGNARIKNAITEALNQYTYLAEPWNSHYRAKAAKLIVHELLGSEGWAGGVRFVSTGSEAIEMALIMAKLFTGRSNIITQEFSYHGWTMGAAGTTGLRSSRGNTSSIDGEIRDVPGYPPAGFHLVPAPSDRIASTGRLECVEQTESIIRNIGPETVAAFICDVSLGAGSIHPPREYIPQIREMTRRLNILWIDDEILCGFGRMGKWFGYQNYRDVTPDIMALGKGMVGSAVPAAAVVVRKDIGAFFRDRRWWLPTTMGAHPIAMAAVVATIEEMMEEQLVERAAETGEYLGRMLRALADRHPCVAQVDGDGLFWVIELTRPDGRKVVAEDRYHMGIGDISSWPTQIVTRACLEEDVFITGFVPNTLRLGPPLIITREECDRAIATLEHALDQLKEETDV